MMRLGSPAVRPTALWLTLVASAALGCDDSPGNDVPREDVPQNSSGAGNSTASPGTGETPWSADNGNGANAGGIPGNPSPVQGAGGTSGSTPGQGAGFGFQPPTQSTTDALPCEVAAIFENSCATCHGSAPQFGAPMPLVSHADLTQLRNGVPVYSTVLERVSDNSRPMPPPPNPRLSQEQMGVLSSWVAAGAPARPAGTECTASSDPVGNPDGASADAQSPADCQDFYELRAHGGRTSSDPSPHAVSAIPPKNNNEYHCFYFRPPYANGDAALYFEPIVDNKRVLHHWLLYGTDNMLQADGSSAPCDASEEGAYLLAGWAPGAGTRVMPEGVAMQMPTSGLILELHYYNTTRTPQNDRSGVRFCTAPQGTRPNLAGVHFTGTEGICMQAGQTREFSGVCRPSSRQDIHIIDVWPHMHELGTHMNLTLNRANGSREIIHDAPFDFNTQIGYETDVVMRPGDTLTTTCRYTNTTNGQVPFGETTQEEMCYGFVTAWPVGALQMNQGLLSGTQPARRCMDGLSVSQSCNGICDAPGYEALTLLFGEQCR